MCSKHVRYNANFFKKTKSRPQFFKWSTNQKTKAPQHDI